MKPTRKRILCKLTCFILAFVFCLRNLHSGATLHLQFNTEEESQSKFEALSLSYYNETLSRLLSSKEDHVDEIRFLPNRSIAFLHIGKTGGSSIRNVFRAACNWMFPKSGKGECLNSVNQVESRLSKLTTSYWHCDPRKRPYDNEKRVRQNTTSFLFSIRHPIHRIVSSFYFTHAKNSKPHPIRKKFNKCFPSIDSLAKSLPVFRKITSSTKIKNNATIDITKDGRKIYPNCVQLLLYAFRGYNGIYEDKETLKTIKRLNSHLVWNYQYFLSRTIEKYPSREVFTVRTEFLWDDMKHLDILLNGTGEEFYHDGLVYSHGSENFTVKSDLSVEGQHNLCCFMYKELEAYQHLLLLSRNLDRGKTYQSLLDLYQDCGVEGSSDENLIHHDGESFFVIDWRKWRRDACEKYKYEDDSLNYFVDYMYPS